MIYKYFICYDIQTQLGLKKSNAFISISNKIENPNVLNDVQNYLKSFYPESISIIINNFILIKEEKNG